MPTKHRRHAITETPDVKEALDELRTELGSERLPLAEVVILGARQKAAQIRCERQDVSAARARLAQRVVTGETGIDLGAADEVRRNGWARAR